ncbi:DUF4416 family protein [Deltaproteobacteria bacterium TL4]
MKAFGKVILGILFSRESLYSEVLTVLKEQYQRGIQRQSPAFPFNQTDYYQAEMGTELSRRFVSFETIEPLDTIVDWKKRTVHLENLWTQQGKRQVNLDPGYIDIHKVILFSHKEGPQKIYIQNNIWADLVLMKAKGGYDTFRWTFPDLKNHQYDDFFMNVRADYKKEYRALTRKEGSLPQEVL